MRSKRWIDEDLIWILIFLLFSLPMYLGCEEAPIRVQPLPAPAAETPPANLPVQMRQHNWTQ